MIFFFYCLAILQTNAQPAEQYRELRILQLTDSLAQDSNNLEFIWERVHRLFNPHFDLYTRPNPNFRQPVPHYYHQTAIERLHIDTLAEINRLIESEAVIKEAGYRLSTTTNYVPNPDVTVANFYHKRGQYYYLANEKEKAFQDFQKALSLDPYQYLKEDICLALAAYYYNLTDVPTPEHLRQALEYIDLVTPIKYEEEARVFEAYSGTFPDRFEREKIALLQATNQKERLVNYLKNLAISYMQLYLKDAKEPHQEFQQMPLERAFQYMKMLNDYYIRIGETNAPDNVITKMLEAIVEMEN